MKDLRHMLQDEEERQQSCGHPVLKVIRINGVGVQCRACGRMAGSLEMLHDPLKAIMKGGPMGINI